jgi:biotin operon repressor
MSEEAKALTAHYLRKRDKWLRDMADCLDLKPLSVRVGLHLALRMSLRNQEAWPSIETIAASIGASQRGVISALDELKEEGFLGIERKRNKGNRYWLRFRWE